MLLFCKLASVNMVHIPYKGSGPATMDLVGGQVQLRVSSSRYRYPDVMINCIPNSDLRLEETPCFLLEVISESSADIDSNKKLAEYTRIPSVQRYVLIEQHSKLAIVYKRQNGVWLVETIEETGEIEIPCLETVLTLEQIYDGLEFA